MPNTQLISLYCATFGCEPSRESVHVLALLEAFGVLRDDPMAHMTIIQLRAADRMQDLVEEANHVLGKAADHIKDGTKRSEASFAMVDRLAAQRQYELLARERGAANYRDERDPERHIVEFDELTPIVKFLCEAFYRRRRVLSRDNARIVSARWTLAMLLALGACLFLIGHAVGVGQVL